MLNAGFQYLEQRDANDTITKAGVVGKNSPLATSDNSGIYDIIAEDLRWLKENIDSITDDDTLNSIKQSVESMYNDMKTNPNFGSTAATAQAQEALKQAQAAADSASKAKDYSDKAIAVSTTISEIQDYLKQIDALQKQTSDNATTATNKANSASTSASNAKVSETNAKNSETNSKTSETNSKTSETNAATSASNSAASATASANSAKAAADSASKAETSAINDAKQYFNNISTDGAIITITKGDGSTISLTPVLDTPEAHNCIIRGKDLTAQLNDGTLSENIQNGTFHDIFVGDYFTKSYVVDGTTCDVKWIIVDIDYFYYSGDDVTTAHHVVVMPEGCVQINVNMNDTDTTSGGFINSKMWKTTIPAHATGIVSAFGDAHVLQHRELLSNATSDTAASAAGAGWTGASTGGGWYDVKVNIPSEPMIYGGAVFGSSGYDVGNKNRQLAYFRCKPFCMNGKWFWLQAVASGTYFCRAGGYGDATCRGASTSSVSPGGFRPYFLYH